MTLTTLVLACMIAVILFTAVSPWLLAVPVAADDGGGDGSSGGGDGGDGGGGSGGDGGGGDGAGGAGGE